MSGSSRPIPTFTDRYAVQRELGRGATSTVYLANDATYSRLVAIKVLRPELAQSIGADRFLREIRLTAQLHHPNIVQLLDSGEQDDTLYFVLPYLDGGTLRDRLERERQLPLDEAIGIARTIALALDYAHERGLVHRDVKPENILFTGGVACLADFGIARALERGTGETTSTGIVRGTPAYMSPEQAGGDKAIDGRSDLYSLACVLYEMVTGMTPFVGPTPQSVMAQRITVTPRPASVYRNTVSPELDAVLERAMSVLPADRFQTGKGFAEALALSPPRAGRLATILQSGGRRDRRPKVLGLLAIGAGITAVALASLAPRWKRDRLEYASDTTRLVIFPVDADSFADQETTRTEFLVEAFARWKGVVVIDQFQVADALRRSGGSVSSNSDARSIARGLRAGRFLRARSARVGDSLHLSATLYDAGSDSILSSTQIRVPRSTAGVEVLFAQLADSRLIRGAPPATIGRRMGTRSLPALQAFATGQRALEEWDLSAAESSFQRSARFDPAYVRAYLWQAQVRDWDRQPIARWAPLVERAMADTGSLSDRELRLANALSAMARHDFERACKDYDAMRAVNDRDFAAWFGLGRCRSLDDVVRRDARSPSGWSYRSSYHQALLAFGRAFDVLPSVSRGFEKGAFESLQSLLFTRGRQQRGGRAAAPDSGRFIAFHTWQGDTLAFVPYPAGEVGRLAVRSIRADRIRALQAQRELFRRIASGWATALPQSAGAKEALAIALDLIADRAAIDTIRVARRLTSDSLRHLRLASAEVIMRLKYAIPDDLAGIDTLRTLADSLLRRFPHVVGPEAAALLPIAQIVGDCARIEELARLSASEVSVPIAIPRHLNAAARELAALSSIGCAPEFLRAAVGRLADDIDRYTPDAANQVMLKQILIAQSLPLLFPRESSYVTPALAGDDYMLMAERAALRGDSGEVRAIFDRVRRARAESPEGRGSTDAVLSEATLMLAVGDSASAVAWLDSAFVRTRQYPTVDFRENVATAGALMRSIALRAQLASLSRDYATAARWGQVLHRSWPAASPELRAMTRPNAAVRIPSTPK